MHFQEDELLRRTVILKPTWGTDAVYKVLDNEAIKAAHGRFLKSDLKNIWHASAYTDMRPELLQLMINFKLCYALAEPGHYIAPQLLSKEKPVYNWCDQDNLQLRYTYPRFMPKGILSRFIVAVHSLIEDQRQRAWQHGVVLNDHDTRAEVREDVERRELRIRLCGDQQRDLLTTVVYELEKIHQGLHDLEYAQKIPCNCSACLGKQEPEFYRYANLKRFQKDRQATIQCQASYQPVDVRALLDNVIDERRLHLDKHQQPLTEPVQTQVNIAINQPTDSSVNTASGSHTMLTNQHQQIERYLAYGIGVAMVLFLIGIALFVPNPTEFQYTLFRIVLSVATAGVALFIPGLLKAKWGKRLSASGAMAVFVIVYFCSPAMLPEHEKARVEVTE